MFQESPRHRMVEAGLLIAWIGAGAGIFVRLGEWHETAGPWLWSILTGQVSGAGRMALLMAPLVVAVPIVYSRVRLFRVSELQVSERTLLWLVGLLATLCPLYLIAAPAYEHKGAVPIGLTVPIVVTAVSWYAQKKCETASRAAVLAACGGYSAGASLVLLFAFVATDDRLALGGVLVLAGVAAWGVEVVLVLLGTRRR